MPSEKELEQRLTEQGANAPRLTPAQIDATIAREEYWNPEGTALTVCVLHLVNGFTVVGQSAAASLTNFRPDIGRDLARTDARNKIWQLEGYLLRQKLHDADRPRGGGETIS